MDKAIVGYNSIVHSMSTNLFQVLPIRTGELYARYEPRLTRVKAMRPEMSSVEEYGWHATKSRMSAERIAQTGFDISKVYRKHYFLLS